LGCNVAWAMVEAVRHGLTELFERGRRAKVIVGVRSAPSDEAAAVTIERELEGRIGLPMSADDRARLYQWLATVARGAERGAEMDEPRVTRGDVLGGIAVAVVIVVATLPVVLPFLIVDDSYLAVRLSNAVAIAMLFVLGVRWAHFVGAN